MPAHSTWPTDDDVIDFLAEAGIEITTPAAEAQVTNARLAAIQAFKTATRWPVFIAGESDFGAAVTDYQCVQGFVKFGGGYVGITVTDADTSVVLAENTDYTVGRELSANGPITWLDLGNSVHSRVTISGTKGVYAFCPDDVWQAILSRTAMRLASVSSYVSVGPFRRIAIGNQDQDVTFASDTIGTLRTAWDSVWNDAVKFYKRR